MLPSVALLVTSLRCHNEGRLSGSHKTWSEIPWGIVFLFGSVQVASKLVQTCDLLGEIFNHFDRTFWVRTSPLGVQMILATMASLLAEITDKRKLVQGMMPIVSNIATFKNMYPTYYAIPVIVGAFSNLIMPASVPLVILHEVARVSFLKLFILGLLLKLLIITMVLITVNSAGKMIYGFGQAAI
ncbi:uncharacterized protein LOC121835716 [Ixodes scapularis]|uniref:uncharacterized protein LOC121835716 n=1 Tax=Ixodes scapularis TaxID=6945 RepID=UPI001C38C9B9|nr:uncharacterized protein LOC121835716 [Ixodes scapularis]